MSTAVEFETRSATRQPETRRRPVAARRAQPKLASRRPEGGSRVTQRPGVVVVQRSLADGALTPPVVTRASPARTAWDATALAPLAVTHPRPVRSRAAGPVRLTRLGRLVISLTLFTVACAGVAAVGGPALSTGEAHHAASRTVVISAGETLWDIAERIAPGADPRAVIDDIVDLNALPDAGAVRVGQQIEVPTY